MFALIWYDQHGLMMMMMVVRGGWRWKILIGQRHAAYRGGQLGGQARQGKGEKSQIDRILALRQKPLLAQRMI